MIDLLQLPFMQNALLAGALMSSLCAFLGVYIILKRSVFLSAALAQVSTTGMALAFLFGLNPVLSSLVVTLMATLMFALRPQGNRMPQDSLLGISYVGAFALSILFMSKSARGSEELQHLLQGNILTITSQQIWLLAGLFLLVSLIHFIFYKEFMFVSYDPTTAQTLGFRVQAWNLLLYLTLALTISITIKVGGFLLVFSLLVIPAATAMLATKKMRLIFIVAIFCALLANLVGIFVSFHFDLPTGPTIVAMLLLFLLLVGLKK